MKKRIDANHVEIVKALRKIGCDVISLAAVGSGGPDLLVGIAGRNYLIEVKNGKKPRSGQKLTPEQIKFHRNWCGQKTVINNINDAVRVVTKT